MFKEEVHEGAHNETWSCPVGTPRMELIECIGGGGVGADTNARGYPGCGAAGGSYANLAGASVYPLSQYSLVVADVRTGPTGYSVLNGYDTYFGNLCSAQGGQGGNGMTHTPGYGSVSSSWGDETQPGGDGGNGTIGASGGGGGGGASDNSSGGDASGSTGGTAVSPAGAGGDGDNVNVDGHSYGGGGAGGWTQTDGITAYGGDGAAGWMRLRYITRNFLSCCGAGV